MRNWKSFLINLAIPLGVGVLSGFLTRNSMEFYQTLNRPALSPPSVVFPIVWTILYILMGISAYLIYESDSSEKAGALSIYGIQLFFNFMWSIIFFNLKQPLFAFLWLIILWILILVMIVKFYKINKTAGLLQIPYLLWVTFAGYLNFAVFLLNR